MPHSKGIETGIVGLGDWGSKLARNFHFSPNANLAWLCDLDDTKLQALQRQFPAKRTSNNFDDLSQDDELEAIVIATSSATHFPLCKAALLAGKDVFVEKPFVLSVPHAEELIRIAEENERILMVGHLLEYHPVVSKLKQLIRSGELGDVRYIYSQRLNLCSTRNENAMWDFAPHDISVILHLLDMTPDDVAARGQCYVQPGTLDVVFLTLNFAGTAMGHVHVSWLDPNKTRKLTVVGSKRMAVFDDIESNEKLKIYDNGVEPHFNYQSFDAYAGVRFGDIAAPYVGATEPLQIECEHFLSCVRERRQPQSDGRDGLRVVQVLSAADRSLKQNGKPVSLNS